jgi:hypothetical protein
MGAVRMKPRNEVEARPFFADNAKNKEVEKLLRFHNDISNNSAEGVLLVQVSDEKIVFTNSRPL